MRSIVAVLLMAVLVCCGCASTADKPRLVILQDPETMEFVDCKVSDGFATSAAFEKNDECVVELKKKGFVVWGEL